MKYTLPYQFLLALGLSVAYPPLSHAQWLQNTSTTPGVATTASFPNATGPYTGSITAIASNFVDGAANGIPGIVPTAFTNVSASFLANFSLNPGGTFDYLNVGYNDPGDSFDVTFSFTGLALGYLPAGAILAFLDIDINENVHNLQAFGPGNVPIMTPWLTPLASPANLFDYNNPDGGIAPGSAAVISESSGVYNLLGQSSNQDAAFQGFRLTQNVTSITWHFDRSPGGGGGTGGYGVAIAIPEPSTNVFLLVGGVAALVAYAPKYRSRALFGRLR